MTTLISLEKKVENVFKELEISENQQKSIITFTNLIKLQDIPTYEHSLRVGLKGKEILEFTHILNPKTLFYAGLLHDVGKVMTAPESLKKSKGFEQKDMKELQKHPLDGYRLLRGIHDLSAEILLRHHTFQKGGYPKNLPKSSNNYSNSTLAIIEYGARLLSIVDFYDSVTHRKNDKFSQGKPRLPTRKESKKLLIGANSGQEYFINQLYNNGIFR